MTQVSGIPEYRLGLCRKPPAVHTLQMNANSLFINTGEGVPGGSDRGSGGISRGISAALSGMRTLNRNRQLLGFTLLAALVLGGNSIAQGALFSSNRIMADTVVPLVLTFFLDFATLFCLMFLLTGLVLSISSGRGGSALFFAGFFGAKKYLKQVFVWSLVLAVAGMLLDRIFLYPGGFLWPFSSSLLSLLSQFPFTLNLSPSTFSEIPGYGGRSLLFWTYPYGFENALTFCAISLLLFILTPFVVPFVVLEQKNLREAVTGSFALMKKTLPEAVVCAAFLGLFVSGVFFMYLLIQGAHGMVTPPEILPDRPTAPWLGVAILYYLALFSTVFVAATVGGIATLVLYALAKRRSFDGSSKNNGFEIRTTILLILIAVMAVFPVSGTPADAGVTMTADGDRSCYLGENVVLHGQNTESDSTYLYLTGPNLAVAGGKLTAPDKAAVSGKPDTFTVVKTKPDTTWEYSWYTANLPLDAGSYTLYAESQPKAMDHAGPAAASISIIVKKPFIAAQILPASVTSGQPFAVTGTAEGDPPSVRVWILGNNYAFTAKPAVDANASFTFSSDAAMSGKLPEGLYWLFVQHPMQDNRFDIGVSGDFVRNEKLSNGTDLFKITGPGSLQGNDAADALVAAFGNEEVCDDTYTVVPFWVTGAGSLTTPPAPAETTLPMQQSSLPVPLHYAAPIGAGVLLLAGLVLWKWQ